MRSTENRLVFYVSVAAGLVATSLLLVYLVSTYENLNAPWFYGLAIFSYVIVVVALAARRSKAFDK